MSRLRKSPLSFFLILILICSVTLVGCGSKGPIEGKSPKEVAQISLTQMSTAKNYDMDLSMQLGMSFLGQQMNVDMKGTATYFANPLKMKTQLNTTTNMGALGGGNQNVTMEQYIVAENNAYTLYQKDSNTNQWQKTSINQTDLAQKTQMNPTTAVQLFMDNLKEAKLDGEETLGSLQTQKITLVSSGEIFEKLLDSMDTGNLADQFGGITPEILKQGGDITYTIWVDKATANLVKCSMDLSTFIQNLAPVMIKDMPEAQAMSEQEKVLMEQLFKSLTILVEYSVKNIDQAQDFTLPAEAASAQPLNTTP